MRNRERNARREGWEGQSMEKPIHVLHVLGGVSLGGAESRIKDLYRQMDREEIQFDFLVHQSDVSVRKSEFYDEEIHAMGGHIYVLPKFKVYNYFAYRKAVKAFFASHREFRASICPSRREPVCPSLWRTPETRAW